jgi:hypothetical protein
MTPKEDTLAYQIFGCAMEVYKTWDLDYWNLYTKGQ